MVNLNASGYPTVRGWGDAGRSSAQLTRINLAGSDALPIRVDSRIAVLAQHLVDGLVAIRAAARRSALTSSGGYNKRYISGTTRWSNHSWGLAMDLNAGANPYSRTLQTDFPEAATRALANSLGFRWGRDYVNQKFDPMHFEFMGTPADAATITRTLQTAADAAPTEKGFLMALTDQQQTEIYNILHNGSGVKLPFLSEQELDGDPTGPAYSSDALRQVRTRLRRTEGLVRQAIQSSADAKAAADKLSAKLDQVLAAVQK